MLKSLALPTQSPSARHCMKFERRRSNVNISPNKPLSILEDNTTSSNEYQSEDDDGDNDENEVSSAEI